MLLLFASTAAVAQSLQVEVTVVNEAGEPQPGAFVQVKGTQSGAATDLDGRALLTKVPAGSVILVSLIGYLDAEEPVGDRSAFTVVLKDDVEALEEVVVIGYGTAKRKDFVGSVSQVRLTNSPVALMNNSNALEALKGNVAGLDIGAVSNAGGQPSMQMRGQRSISGSNAPLIVVDGVIFIGGLNEINPADIATIDVLKMPAVLRHSAPVLQTASSLSPPKKVLPTNRPSILTRRPASRRGATNPSCSRAIRS